jgi:hypothetical protein
MAKLAVALVCSGLAIAQLPENSAPDPALSQPKPGTSQPESDKHILGVVPNYATVNDPTQHFQSIPVKEKFKLASQDAFDPFSWVITGIYAGVAQWGNDYAGYGQGAQGYAKRYGAAFADGAIGNYMTEAVIPTLLHQDPRYFRLGTGGAWKRVGYAMSRTIVTHGDSGAWQFNTSEIAGNAIAAGIANLYYPAQNRTAGDTLEKFGVNVISDAGFNVLKEFWPDMRRKILHKE